MTTSTDTFFSGLAESLCERSARATVSQAGPHNPALRTFLLRSLSAPPDTPGSFLAPPVFESLFNWETQDKKFKELTFVHPQLIAAMDAPPKHLAEERFPATRKPYVHQVKAWEELMLTKDGPARSTIISTGTASGKTECFLVPILSSLYEQASKLHEGETLTGVQAIFLYPLNALINSQKDRLEAWTAGAKGGIRFCLYNGATPNSVQAHEHSRGYIEVKSRDELAKDPPPVLVTNATMLEYMLVRQAGRRILEASRGKLRWIVLDEAHTYVGSNAAEISLLLRRIMHAFGVESERVQFIATSATLGDKVGGDELRKYLADLAGVSIEQVSFVSGSRTSPSLSAPSGIGVGLDVGALAALSGDARFEALAAVPALREVRTTLGTAPLRLSDVAQKLGVDEPTAVKLLDLASNATNAKGEHFLPLRGHYFHRVQEGLWACSNASCNGKATELQRAEWGFGALYLDHRERCSHCDSLVYELVLCKSCGQEHLVAELHNGVLQAIPADGAWDTESDAGEADDDDEQLALPSSQKQLLCGVHAIRDAQSDDAFDPKNGEYPGADGGQPLRLARTEGGLRCSRCGIRAEGHSGTMRPLRLGGDFYLATAVPALLETLPPDEKGQGKPAAGRQLITFSDSRQGSATFAARTQYEAERSFLRASVYHRLWEQTQHEVEDPELKFLRESIERFRKSGNADAVKMLQAQLATKRESKKSGSELSWAEMVRFLTSQSDLENHIRSQLQERYIAVELSEEQLAEILLLREFFRRPKKQNSLETLGLVSVGYRGLEGLDSPPEWKERGYTGEQWRELLEALLTFQVRASSSVILDHSELRLMGVPAYPKYLTPADRPLLAGQTVRWPQLVKGRGSQVARALAVALYTKPGDARGEGLVNSILAYAWKQIQVVLQDKGLGWRLDLRDRVNLRTVDEAFVCPITNRVLTSTFLGVTPFVEALTEDRSLYECRKVRFPRPPAVRQRGPFDCASAELELTEEWLRTNEDVIHLRNLGVWFEFSDRIVRGPAYFGAAEHSAQLSAKRLRELEGRFKNKDLNILSCSTTMEMGVNIGSLAAVTMNNVPPGPANFLQRAGRAGRTGQARALTLTMCRGRAHDLEVYRNPLWPFSAPIRAPRVALNSERIARRHVNSMLFAAFVNRHAEEGHTLSSEWLFGGAAPRSNEYVTWIETTAMQNEPLLQGVTRLLRGSPLSHLESSEVLNLSAFGLRKRAEKWCVEETMLKEQLEKVGADTAYDPARRSLEIQLKRHRDEFLLSNLANSSFLPSYGFPLNVVPFVTLTHEERQMKRKQRDAKKTQGSSSERVYHDFPTRHLAAALREYAPGAAIVLDGLVYQSEGVTLNWQIPTSGEDVKGIADLRFHYRCGKCGAVKSTEIQASHCQACGHEVKSRRYLRPSGFAVDLFSNPSTDLSLTGGYARIETNISANTNDWRRFSASQLGRFRFSHDGNIIFRNSGPSRRGYALCLRCGRVAPESGWADGARQNPAMNGHRSLRGAKGARCEGNEGSFAIQRNVELGASITTDVLELEFLDPQTGTQLNDESLATTLSVALQLAAAELLEVEPSEIGRAINDYEADDGGRHRSIILYDTAGGGAGYVSSLPIEFDELFRRARKLLLCTGDESGGGCDSSCHNCLLSFATQDESESLNRHLGLQFLSERTLEGFSLSPARAVFGPNTSVEYSSLEVLTTKFVDGSNARRALVHLSAPANRWDFAGWAGWEQLRGLAHHGCQVDFVVPKAVLEGLEWDQRNTVASYLKGSGGTLRVVDSPARVGELFVLLEFALAAQHFRVAASESLAPDELWKTGLNGAVSVLAQGQLPALPGKVVELDAVQRPVPGTFAELKFGKALEGTLKGFGHRFLSAIAHAEPRLKGIIDGRVQLSAFRYEDKYLSSPMAVALLDEVLREAGVKSPEFVGRVVTTAVSPRQRPMRASDDFEGLAQQKQAIEKLCDLKPEILEARQARHRRELLLEWENGAKLILRLDHGLGFMKLDRPEGMEFDGSGADVMERFFDMKHRLVLREQGLAYLSFEVGAK